MGARGWVVGAVVVVVVAGGAVVGDRVAAAEAERTVQHAIATNLDDVTGSPDVQITGFPFLTQYLRGSLDDVTAHVDGASLAGIAATDIDLRAADVSTSAPYTLGTARLDATLPLAAVQKLVADRAGLDLTLAVDPSDAGAMTATAQVLGIDLSLTLVPSVRDGQIHADVRKVSLGGLDLDVSKLPGGLGDKLTQLTFPVDGLPDGVELTHVAATPAGLRLTATGTHVELPAAS